MFKRLCALALIGGMVGGATATPAKILPSPKNYELEKGIFTLSELPIFYQQDNKQCKIAADEIVLRLRELGATPGRLKPNPKDTDSQGIYIFVCDSEDGKALAKKYKLDVTPKKPGPQGYMLRAENRRVVIIGSDSIGALYGAMTLRQMLTDKGIVQAAVVTDHPDIHFRSAMSFGRGIMKLANQEKNSEQAVKTGINWFMRYKLNVMTDPFVYATSPDEELDFKGKMAKYAFDRGIYLECVSSVCLYNIRTKKPGMNLKSWPCVSESRGTRKERYYCWSNDDATRKRAEKEADFLNRINASIVVLHPVDGGAVNDPELWSKRCDRCRERWGDDERWKATVNQLNIWNDVFREKLPEHAITGSYIYPYTIQLISAKDKLDKQTYNRNVTDFWSHVDKGINDRRFFFGSWMAPPRDMALYRKVVNSGRPLKINEHYPITRGIFNTYHRFARSAYENNSRNMLISKGTDIYGQWESALLLVEHAWNLRAPGSEDYAGGTFYDPLIDHTGPKDIIELTLPKITDTFWNAEMAPHMTKVFASGIMPDYIADPASAVNYWNKYRRDPLKDLDVNAKKSQTDGMTTARYQPIIDSVAMMGNQVKQAETVVNELNKAYQYFDKLGKYKRKYFLYYYKRAPFWLMTARARYNNRYANELITQSKNTEALTVLNAGLVQLEKDFSAAMENYQKLEKMPDTEYHLLRSHNRLNKLGETKPEFTQAEYNLGVRPYYADLKKTFTENIASAMLVLQPRRIGRYIKVGITSGREAEGIKEYLDGFANVKATIIDSISLLELDKYDCVFATNKPYILNEFFRNFKRYVEIGGGGVLFEAALCGFKPRFDAKTPFPEIVQNAPERIDNFSQEMVWNSGKREKFMYVDFFSLNPGPAGQIIAKSMGKNLAVQGKAGLGKVIFSGTPSLASINNSYSSTPKKLFGYNAELAKYAIEYFTGIKPRLRGDK